MKKEEQWGRYTNVTPLVRLSFWLEGINIDRQQQIKEAIMGFFPLWEEDDWWWKLLKSDHSLEGSIDGWDFSEVDETAEDEGGVESKWMDKVALAVWKANGAFCSLSWDLNGIPWVDGHYYLEDFEELSDGQQH